MKFDPENKVEKSEAEVAKLTDFAEYEKGTIASRIIIDK